MKKMDRARFIERMQKDALEREEKKRRAESELAAYLHERTNAYLHKAHRRTRMH